MNRLRADLGEFGEPMTRRMLPNNHFTSGSYQRIIQRLMGCLSSG